MITRDFDLSRLIDPGTPMQIDSTPVMRNTPTQPISKRHMTAMELLQTETNYVRILQTIITVSY